MSRHRSHLHRAVLSLAALTLCACAGGLADDRFATGSSSMAASANYGALFVANPDQGTVSRVELASGTVTETDVGLDPVRVARAGEYVFVSLRGERAVAVLEDTGTRLNMLTRVAVGAEPYGVVANEAGTTVWVANQLGGTVSEIDVHSLTVTRDLPVDGQPRFLALHSSGNHLYVGSAMGGILTDIDLRTGNLERVALPENTALDPNRVQERVRLTPRITGDLSVAPDGSRLLVPVLYVNNRSSVAPPEVEGPDDPDDPPLDGYAGDPESLSDGARRRMNAGAVSIPAKPSGALEPERSETLIVEGFNGGMRLAGYPSSATVSPDGTAAVFTMEGADAAIVVQLPSEVRGRDRYLPAGLDRSGAVLIITSMSATKKETVLTASGPRGVAFVDKDEAWVHAGFDHSVAPLRYAAPIAGIEARTDGVRESHHHTLFRSTPQEASYVAGDAIAVTDEVLPPELVAGRRLFYTAANDLMGIPSAGLSCATCHFDGRTDGLSWPLEAGVRQTPSLAGQVSLTAPVTWTSDVESVAAEAMITSETRMGGDGIAEIHGERIAAFIDWTAAPDTPLRGVENDAIARGRAIFESAEVGCAGCHSGPAYTDNVAYDMYGLRRVRTRSLVGVAATAPYLHDGSAPTLHAVVESARDGEMGDTSSLSVAEVDDLVAYLKSL